MKADEVKNRILQTLLFDKSYQCAVTEYSGEGVQGIADVFGFTKAGYSHEIEVKVALSDLRGELNSINLLMSREVIMKNGEQDYSYSSCFKINKHCSYLDSIPPGEVCIGGREERSVVNIPCLFSFAVPDEMRTLALDILKDSPYGLFTVRKRKQGLHNYYTYDEVKKAEKLHKEKVSEKTKEYMIRKSSLEVLNLRQKIIYN